MREADWFRGERLVVTRARHQAAPLEDLIRQRGGVPVPYPCIAIEAPADLRPLAWRLRQLDEFDWLLLTSRNAVQALSDLPGAALDLATVKVAAVGPATRAALQRQLGIDCDFRPSVASADALAQELPLRRPGRVLMPQSNLADNAAPAILRSRGAAVTTVIAYKTVVGAGGADLPAMIARGDIDALTFMSPSAARFWRRRCPAPEALSLPAACIGRATAKAAHEVGFQQVIASAEHSARGMLQALADFFTSVP